MPMSHPYSMPTPYPSLPAQVWEGQGFEQGRLGLGEALGPDPTWRERPANRSKQNSAFAVCQTAKPHPRSLDECFSRYLVLLV